MACRCCHPLRLAITFFCLHHFTALGIPSVAQRGEGGPGLLKNVGNKLKIVLVTHPTTEFDTTAVLAKELAERGHDVQIMCTADRMRAVPEGVGFFSVGEYDNFLPQLQSAVDRVQYEPPKPRSFQPLSWPTYLKLQTMLDRGMSNFFDRNVTLPDVCVISSLMESLWESCMKRNVPVVVQNPGVFMGTSLSPEAPHEDILTLDFPNRPVSAYRGRNLKETFIGVAAWAYVRLFAPLNNEVAETVRPNLLPRAVRMSGSVPGFDFPKSNSPMVHYTGPILHRRAFASSNLNEAIFEFLEESVALQLPVVYVSFGNLVQLSPKNFAAVFEGLSSEAGRLWRVLWAHRDWRELVPLGAQRSPHMKMSEWVTGPAVMAHNATKVVFCNCGSKSVHEALYNKRAVLGMPFYGDQMPVCERVLSSAVGRIVNHHTITPEVVKNELTAMLHPAQYEQYRQKAEQLSLAMKFMGGLNRAADLVELTGAVGMDLVEMWQSTTEREGIFHGMYLDFVIGLAAITFLAGIMTRALLRGVLTRGVVWMASVMVRSALTLYRFSREHRADRSLFLEKKLY